MFYLFFWSEFFKRDWWIVFYKVNVFFGVFDEVVVLFFVFGFLFFNVQLGGDVK